LRSFTDAAAAPFTIGPAATAIHADPAEWRARFAAEGAIVCRDALAPSLLARLMAAADAAGWAEDRVDRVGRREVEEPRRVGSTLSVLLGRPALVGWLAAVTGRAGLAAVEGRLARTSAGGAEALGWHTDLDGSDRRGLGVTLGLTGAEYDGGEFELRRAGQPRTTHRFRHTRAGTLLVFDLAPDLEHRLLPVVAGGPRRVYAGWFVREGWIV
jgi:hypothetical protein